MRTHSARSERIVLALGLDDGAAIAAAVRQHHERFDGRGYPDGLAGEAIDILARIIAIADAYDAMAIKRSFGVPRPHPVIMRELHREKGAQHDPYLIGKLATFIDSSPFKAD